MAAMVGRLLRIAGLYQIRMRPEQDIFSFLIMYNCAPSAHVWARYDLKATSLHLHELVGDELMGVLGECFWKARAQGK